MKMLKATIVIEDAVKRMSRGASPYSFSSATWVTLYTAWPTLAIRMAKYVKQSAANPVVLVTIRFFLLEIKNMVLIRRRIPSMTGPKITEKRLAAPYKTEKHASMMLALNA